MTDNIDACRDLQGRRVRHKTAEAKAEDLAEPGTGEGIGKGGDGVCEEIRAETRRRVDVQEVKDMAKKTRQDVKVAVSAGLARAPVGELKKPGKKLALYDDDDSSCSDDE
eukprot:jgi/Picre1/30815/NNA_006175.t1